MWNRETLDIYRSQKGWQKLKESEIDQILSLINNIEDFFQPMVELAWVEPEIEFTVMGPFIGGN